MDFTVQDRVPLWDRMRSVQANGSWITIGDFNTILHVEDRMNGALVHQTEIEDFQQCIGDIGARQITKEIAGLE